MAQSQSQKPICDGEAHRNCTENANYEQVSRLNFISDIEQEEREKTKMKQEKGHRDIYTESTYTERRERERESHSFALNIEFVKSYSNAAKLIRSYKVYMNLNKAKEVRGPWHAHMLCEAKSWTLQFTKRNEDIKQKWSRDHTTHTNETGQRNLFSWAMYAYNMIHFIIYLVGVCFNTFYGDRMRIYIICQVSVDKSVTIHI